MPSIIKTICVLLLMHFALGNPTGFNKRDTNAGLRPVSHSFERRALMRRGLSRREGPGPVGPPTPPASPTNSPNTTVLAAPEGQASAVAYPLAQAAGAHNSKMQRKYPRGEDKKEDEQKKEVDTKKESKGGAQEPDDKPDDQAKKSEHSKAQKKQAKIDKLQKKLDKKKQSLAAHEDPKA